MSELDSYARSPLRTLADTEHLKKYLPIYGNGHNQMCSQCSNITQTYYIGTFTKLCSKCIEQDFERKFNSLIEDFKKYKAAKL